MGAVNSAWVGHSLQSKVLKIGDTKLSETDLQELLRTQRFMKYLIHMHPQIGELWDAFVVAERLEK